MVMLIPLLWLIFLGCSQDNDSGTGPSPTTYGSIYIESTPSGASVFLDDSNTGEVTPTTLTDVETGYHTVKLVKEDYLDWTQTVYVCTDETTEIEATLSQFALNVYWPITCWPIGRIDRTDSAWVVKDSIIQLEVRDQNGNPVSGVSWHTSDPTVISISSDGVVTGLKDWFDNHNSQPEAIVWVTKNELTSNEIVIQTVVNLTGWWGTWSSTIGETLYYEVEMSYHFPNPNSPIYNPGRVYACGFSPIGAFIVLGDSIYWESEYDDSWASGHILENGTRVEFRMYRESYPDSIYDECIYIKNPD